MKNSDDIKIRNIFWCPTSACGIQLATVNGHTFIGKCDNCGYEFDVIRTAAAGLYGTRLPKEILDKNKERVVELVQQLKKEKINNANKG